MMTNSPLRPSVVWIELGDGRYPLMFDLNAADEIQTRCGRPLTEILGSALTDETAVYGLLRTILTALINEGIAAEQDAGRMMDEKPKDEQWVGRQISSSLDAVLQLRETIIGAISDNLPDAENEDTEENPQTEQA